MLSGAASGGDWSGNAKSNGTNCDGHGGGGGGGEKGCGLDDFAHRSEEVVVAVGDTVRVDGQVVRHVPSRRREVPDRGMEEG